MFEAEEKKVYVVTEDCKYGVEVKIFSTLENAQLYLKRRADYLIEMYKDCDDPYEADLVRFSFLREDSMWFEIFYDHGYDGKADKTSLTITEDVLDDFGQM